MDRSGRDEVELTDGGTVPVWLENLETDTVVVPRGFFYPMCGMNVCFRIEMLPAMYFGLQGHLRDASTGDLRKLEYDRYGDIWAGMISKLAADLTGSLVTSGPPNVIHLRASNCLINADKERRGLLLHPKLLRDVFSSISPRTPSQLRCTGMGAISDVVWEVSSILRGEEGHLVELGYDDLEIVYLRIWGEALETWLQMMVL
jgi:hypothetical protein